MSHESQRADEFARDDLSSGPACSDADRSASSGNQAAGPRYRHPATVLLLGLILVSYLVLVGDAMRQPPPGTCGTTEHRSWFGAFLYYVPHLDRNALALLLVAAVPGIPLFVFARSWFDRYFGRRPEPFYRFGLRVLLVSMGGAAVLFALTARERVEFAAGAVVALAIPIAVMGIAVWVSDRERTIRQDLAELARSGDVLESNPSEP